MRKTKQQKESEQFWNFIPKHRYNSYGKVKYINPKKVMKKAFILDTVIPLTFFVPVILAGLFYVFTRGKEFKIIIKNG